MRPTSRLKRYPLAIAILLVASQAWAEESMHERYTRLKGGMVTTLPGTAISITSNEQDEVLSAEVSSLMRYPYPKVAAALSEAANWCQFLPLHFNIKACTFEGDDSGKRVNLYSGRKHYQTPRQSHHMTYRFDLLAQDDNQLQLQLSAANGPAGTRDYRIELTAMRVDEGTLLYMKSSYRPSLTSSLLAGGYLATLGREKIGFSRIERGGSLQPVTGIRGVIERNVMRYHLAIDAYFSAPSSGHGDGHEAMLQKWISLNEQYAEQLHEMSREEYLEAKRKEWRNQQQLQQLLDEKMQQAAAT